MGHLGSSDWWWDTALQGVVGSVIGGLVTLAVLWGTLRHETNRARLDQFTQECLRLANVSRGLSQQALFGDLSYPFGWWAWTKDMTTLLNAADDEPVFTTLLLEAQTVVAKHGAASAQNGKLVVPDLQGLTTALQNVETLLKRRVYSPKYFKMNEQTLQVALKHLREGYSF